jgi:hypothetical protein
MKPEIVLSITILALHNSNTSEQLSILRGLFFERHGD